MFKALFNIIFNLLASLIQVVCLPLNVVVENALPDFSAKVADITSTFSQIFLNIQWALGLVPAVVVETVLFIISVEIAKHTIYVSTHTLIKVWNLFQKIKFW